MISGSFVLKLSIMTPDEKAAAYITHNASQTLSDRNAVSGSTPRLFVHTEPREALTVTTRTQ